MIYKRMKVNKSISPWCCEVDVFFVMNKPINSLNKIGKND